MVEVVELVEVVEVGACALVSRVAIVKHRTAINADFIFFFFILLTHKFTNRSLLINFRFHTCVEKAHKI